MAKYGKFFGAGLGWVCGGPIGAAIGLGIGWMFDSASNNETDTENIRTTSGDFGVSLMVLFAAVMKADGKVIQAELNFVKAFLAQKFDAQTAKDALGMLRDLLKQEIALEDVSKQIRYRMDYHSRLELLHLLYGLANSDKELHHTEKQILEKIGYYLGLSVTDQQSIRNMFVPEVDSAYKILGVDKNAPIEEIKKTYRKLASENHPDKVGYLGEEIRKDADEKFRKINEAYEKIKKDKGIK